MTAELERMFHWKDGDGLFGKENPTIQAFIKIFDYTFNDDTYTGNEINLPAPGKTHLPLMKGARRASLYSAIQNNELNEASLDAFAEQCNFLGWYYAGKYNIVTTIKDRKNTLIKSSRELSHHIGTPHAVYRILELMGYSDIEIIENVGDDLMYNGLIKYDGNFKYFSDLDRHFFDVELTSDHEIDIEEEQAIINLVNLYKKYRVEFFKIKITDPVHPDGRYVINPIFKDTIDGVAVA